MPDVRSFIEIGKTKRFIYTEKIIIEIPFPDVSVEITAFATLNQIRDIMRLVEDGHVMLETLRQCELKDNSLERDYDLE